MTYKLMSVNDIQYLYSKLGYLTVKFPKSNKEFFCQGDLFTANNRVRLFQSGSGHEVHTSAQELLVEMTYQTYQLRRLQNDADYELALAVFEQYMGVTLPKEGLHFMYLLGLVIADYESQHYPIASLSTVDFIDTLLEERGQTWLDVSTALGYGREVNPDFVRSMIDDDLCGYRAIVKLSHFFRLPVQAFIVGGYGE